MQRGLLFLAPALLSGKARSARVSTPGPVLRCECRCSYLSM
jgi:hypothetical protein